MAIKIKWTDETFWQILQILLSRCKINFMVRNKKRPMLEMLNHALLCPIYIRDIYTISIAKINPNKMVSNMVFYKLTNNRLQFLEMNENDKLYS